MSVHTKIITTAQTLFTKNPAKRKSRRVHSDWLRGDFKKAWTTRVTINQSKKTVQIKKSFSKIHSVWVDKPFSSLTLSSSHTNLNFDLDALADDGNLKLWSVSWANLLYATHQSDAISHPTSQTLRDWSPSMAIDRVGVWRHAQAKHRGKGSGARHAPRSVLLSQESMLSYHGGDQPGQVMWGAKHELTLHVVCVYIHVFNVILILLCLLFVNFDSCRLEIKVCINLFVYVTSGRSTHPQNSYQRLCWTISRHTCRHFPWGQIKLTLCLLPATSSCTDTVQYGSRRNKGKKTSVMQLAV